jgi:hypothetical protein
MTRGRCLDILADKLHGCTIADLNLCHALRADLGNAAEAVLAELAKEQPEHDKAVARRCAQIAAQVGGDIHGPRVWIRVWMAIRREFGLEEKQQ